MSDEPHLNGESSAEGGGSSDMKPAALMTESNQLLTYWFFLCVLFDP